MATGRCTIQEIAKVLVTKNGLEQRDASRFATEMFAVIHEQLAQNDQVKVKGLGTFKVITVEARESVSVRTGDRVLIGEHSKITFTPDTTMKELVNKPFSQFETVVLNDNVEFADLIDGEEDESLRYLDEIENETPSQEDEASSENEASNVESEVVSIMSEPVYTEPEPIYTEPEPVTVEPEPAEPEPAEPEPVTIEPEPSDIEPEDVNFVPEPVYFRPEAVNTEPEPDTAEPKDEIEDVADDADDSVANDDGADADDSDADDNGADADDNDADDSDANNGGSKLKWLWASLGVISLMALSAFGGYYYGSRQAGHTVVLDTVFVADTIYVPETADTTMFSTPATPEAVEATEEQVQPENAQPKADKTQPEPAKTEKQKAEPAKAEQQKAEPAQEAVDKYAHKDVRVRLGAYRIVGLDHEVKVLAGQTFYSICRAHLGPDMECYVEVFNDLPQNPKIKEGQVIKIPKLQLKKRRKQ